MICFHQRLTALEFTVQLLNCSHLSQKFLYYQIFNLLHIYIYIGGLLTDIAEVEDVALVVPWLGLPAWLH